MKWNRSPHPLDLVTPLLNEAAERGLKSGFQPAVADDAGADLLLHRQYFRQLLAHLEVQLHGPLAQPRASMEEVRRILLSRRVALTATPQSGSPSAWIFEWRRASLAAVLAGAAGVAGVVFTDNRMPWPYWALLVLGAAATVLVNPRELRTTAINLAAATARNVRCLTLDLRLARVERRIETSKNREEIAERWVEANLALVMSRFEMERQRGRRAAATLAETTVNETKEDEYENHLHNR